MTMELREATLEDDDKEGEVREAREEQPPLLRSSLWRVLPLPVRLHGMGSMREEGNGKSHEMQVLLILRILHFRTS